MASDINDLPALAVPPKTSGIYITLLHTGEIKIGSSDDIATRNRADGFEGSKILAILPGWRGVEADIHARFRGLRSRSEGEPMFQETYELDPRLSEFITKARLLGFTPEQLGRANWRGVTHVLQFDDGQSLLLEFTYLHVIASGEFVPRYVLERNCSTCGHPRNSLQFLNACSREMLGQRTKAEYLVLESTDMCSTCAPAALPASVAFAGGQTRLRLGSVIASSGETVHGYDRDFRRWVPLRDFGIRRMAKSQRSGHRNDLSTLRLQPSTSRHGRAQGTL
jgi:hypothetical protein